MSELLLNLGLCENVKSTWTSSLEKKILSRGWEYFQQDFKNYSKDKSWLLSF